MLFLLELCNKAKGFTFHCTFDLFGMKSLLHVELYIDPMPLHNPLAMYTNIPDINFVLLSMYLLPSRVIILFGVWCLCKHESPISLDKE